MVRTFKRVFTNKGRGRSPYRKGVLGKRSRGSSRGRSGNSSNYGKSMGRFLGSLSPFAPSLMEKIGGYAGDFIGRKARTFIKGRGDYTLDQGLSPKPRSNTLIKLPPGDQPPQFASAARSVRVTHREYIQDIQSTTGFTTTTLAINPGLSGTFPWLCQLATNFECYRLNGMVFEYKTLSGDALTSTNTALGYVSIATQYNSANPGFLSKQAMDNYEFANSAKPSCSFTHYIECERNATPLSELYIRTAGVPSGQSQQLYDIGITTIATGGFQAAGFVAGELWVTYDVELLHPKLIGGNLGLQLYYWNGVLDTTTMTTSAYFGTAAQTKGTTASNFQPTIGGSTVSFPNNVLGASFMFIYQVGSSGTGGAVPTLAYGTGATALKLWDSGTNSQKSIGVAAGWVIYGAFTVGTSGTVFSLSGGTMPSSLTNANLTFVQLTDAAN